MSWFLLFLAGLLEIAWALGLKAHDGRPLLIGATVVASVASVVLLGIAVQKIPISTAYVAWTGIGILGTVLFGVLWFKEPMTPMRLVWVAVTAVGIIGLKCTSK